MDNLQDLEVQTEQEIQRFLALMPEKSKKALYERTIPFIDAEAGYLFGRGVFGSEKVLNNIVAFSQLDDDFCVAYIERLDKCPLSLIDYLISDRFAEEAKQMDNEERMNYLNMVFIGKPNKQIH